MAESISEIQKDIQRRIEAELDAWGDELEKILKASIRKKKLNVSGELLRSIKQGLASSTAERVVLDIGFAKQGRIAELKSLDYGGSVPPIGSAKSESGAFGLLKWLLNNKKRAKYLPVGDSKYRGYRKPSTFEDYKRIAYAIGLSKRRSKKKRRKKWYTKNFYGYLPELRNRLLEILSEEEIKIFNSIPEEIKL